MLYSVFAAMLYIMKNFLAFALLLSAFSIHAEIYRGVDHEGNVFYSDTEQENSELIPTPTPNTITMPKLETKKPEVVDDKKESAYEAFSIISPTHDATIKENSGNITVSLLIKPKLNVDEGDTIRLSIDDQVVTKRTTSLSTPILNVDRGSHNLKAELINRSGETIMSHSVLFHMKRFSVLH